MLAFFTQFGLRSHQESPGSLLPTHLHLARLATNTGSLMPPRQDKTSGRSVFIKHAIAALEAKPPPASADLAAHAFTKLHYDFPVSSHIDALACW